MLRPQDRSNIRNISHSGHNLRPKNTGVIEVQAFADRLVVVRRRAAWPARQALLLGPALGVEALEAGLGAVVDVAHHLGHGVVAGLLGDEPVHLLGHPPVGRVALGRVRSSSRCIASRALSCITKRTR